MVNFTIPSLFLLYSALSFSAALLIGALFWNKNDASAKLWLYGCLLTSIATAVTVFRADIPLVISFSLMVSFEVFSILLFSQSIRQLSLIKGSLSISKITWLAPILLFSLAEIDRLSSGGVLTPTITALAAFMFGLANFYCFIQSRAVGKTFTNPQFLKFLSIAFIGMTLLYFIRVANALNGYSGFAFDAKSFNLLVWFLIVLLGCFRNLSYIVLRLHLGFTEHSRLNNMNLQLANVIDERNDMIQSLEKFNKSAAINALASRLLMRLINP